MCTDEHVPSVLVTVLDSNGDFFEEPDVYFGTSEMGGFVGCDAYGQGTFVCGWEQEGNLHVAAKADGYDEDSAMVTVEADECHVFTEEITLTLRPIE